MLICHLCIYFGEVSIKISGHFFNWAVYNLILLKKFLTVDNLKKKTKTRVLGAKSSSISMQEVGYCPYFFPSVFIEI